MKNFRLAGSSRMTAYALIAASAVLVSGTAFAVASGDHGPNHSRTAGTSDAAQSEIVGESTAGGCRMGFDTQTSTLIPPDDSTADNVPAATVKMRKVCQGAVVGRFVTETSTSTAGDFIHIDMRATCTGTGGMTDPCTVGHQVFGSPGHTFMQNAQAGVQTHSVTMVWTGLKRGLWRFDVLPGGNNRANLQFRSYVVEAFNAG